MKRLGTFDVSAEDRVEVNMSPLIDIVFLLLIFFVVTTVFVEETGVEIQKPKAVSARDLEKTSILIALTAEGQIVYGGRRVTLNAVRGLVAQQCRTGPVPVVLIGDKHAQMGALVNLIDECKLAGASQVSIAARRE